jgi:hypothetical protein
MITKGPETLAASRSACPRSEPADSPCHRPCSTPVKPGSPAPRGSPSGLPLIFASKSPNVP